MKLTCFVGPKKNAVPVHLIEQNHFETWLTKQKKQLRHWLQATRFSNKPGSVSLVPDQTGQLAEVICCISQLENFWDVGGLPFSLPEGTYRFEVGPAHFTSLAIAWGLGAYQFTRYKKPTRQPAQLVLPKKIDANAIFNIVGPIYHVRDLINTPTEDMGPSELAAVAARVGKKYRARVKQIIGEALIKNNFPCIYTVGRASDDPPRLVELRWGNPKHFKLTLVGKGVCFDSGGLDIKPSSAMLLMKKDMAGAAHVLGLAEMIMAAKLPINLRVLLPIVENVISGNAYRPGDIIKSRKGLTIEIGNTDAEGRVILADVLTAAVEERPDLLIDMTTLTGAARVAVGTEIAAFFANQAALAQSINHHATRAIDPVWQLPLFQSYRESMNSTIADINNSSVDGYAGAITAALFLKEFVPDEVPWLHFDMMAWNLRARPGRPVGGEAMALRAIYNYLSEKTKS